jgi:hypothetical protein
MELEGTGVNKDGQDFSIILRLQGDGDGGKWADYDDGAGTVTTEVSDESADLPVSLSYDESGNRLSVLAHGQHVFDLADLETVRKGGVVRLASSSRAFDDWECSLTIVSL